MSKKKVIFSVIIVLFLLIDKLVMSYIAYLEPVNSAYISSLVLCGLVLFDLVLLVITAKLCKKQWRDPRSIIMCLMVTLSVGSTIISTYAKNTTPLIQITEIQRESDQYIIYCENEQADLNFSAICHDSYGLFLEEGKEYIVGIKQDIFGIYHLKYVIKRID